MPVAGWEAIIISSTSDYVYGKAITLKYLVKLRLGLVTVVLTTQTVETFRPFGV